MGLGVDRDFNAKRLLFLFDTGVCVYPAQNLENYRGGVSSRENEGEHYQKIRFNDTRYSIERNAENYFTQTSETGKFTTFWAPIKQYNSTVIGAIGLQLSQDEYYRLLPKSVIEKPYELSFMSVWDTNNNLIWEEHAKVSHETFEAAKEKVQEIYANHNDDDHAREDEESIQLDDGSQYFTRNISSPIPLIAVHANYEEQNRMFVVCG